VQVALRERGEVGDQHEERGRRFHDLPKQNIGLIDPATRGERPVRTDTFGFHTFGGNDGRIAVPSRRHQSPKPG
jgi:hypothetical protein